MRRSLEKYQGNLPIISFSGFNFKGFNLVEALFFIIAKTVSLTLGIVYYAMLLRMLLPFFTDPEESRIYAITCCVSEPFLAPVRFLMVKLNIGQDSPVDWSFFVTSIVLLILQSILPAI